VKTGWKRGFRVALIAAAAVLVAGGAVAVAQGAHGGKAKKQAVKQLVRLGVHADVSLIRADGTTDAFAVDRGRVTVSSVTSLTLQRLDGKTVTVSLNAGTIARGTVAVGRPVLVFSRSGVAFRIAARGPVSSMLVLAPATAKAKVVHLEVNFVRADGSTGSLTLDRGQVAASSTSSLTIKREDGKSVTFTIAAGAVIRGKLVVGGKALVFSRDGAAFRVFAGRGPTAAG
jgi:riboflavin synthase alpha subunit